MERVFTGRELVNTSSRLERNAALRPVWPVWPVHGSYNGRCEVYTDWENARLGRWPGGAVGRWAVVKGRWMGVISGTASG